MKIMWTENLALDVEEIDDQHKELFNRVNILIDAYEQNKGKEEAAKILKFLEEYVIQHFSEEETLQIIFEYPYYKAHKELHKEFLADFIKLKSQFDRHGASSFLVVQIKEKLIDWLTHHITQIDKTFGNYLIAKIDSTINQPDNLSKKNMTICAIKCEQGKYQQQFQLFKEKFQQNSSLYQILEVEKGASIYELKKARRRLIIRWHPARAALKEKTYCENMLKYVDIAYKTLSNEVSRQEYDKNEALWFEKMGYTDFRTYAE